MKYQFNLYWYELPEQLRDEKIKAYLDGQYVNCVECDGSGKVLESIPAHQEGGEIVDEHTVEKECPDCGGSGEKELTEESEEWESEYTKAERAIEAHFPIYF